jgi:hypothetical protein
MPTSCSSSRPGMAAPRRRPAPQSPGYGRLPATSTRLSGCPQRRCRSSSAYAPASSSMKARSPLARAQSTTSGRRSAIRSADPDQTPEPGPTSLRVRSSLWRRRNTVPYRDPPATRAASARTVYVRRHGASRMMRIHQAAEAATR